MPEKNPNLKESGFLVLRFNSLSKANTLSIAEHLKSFLKATHSRQPKKEIDVCIDGQATSGKTSFNEHLLGIELNSIANNKSDIPEEWIINKHGETRLRVSDTKNFGVLVWMDALGLMVDNDGEPIEKLKQIRTPNHHRKTYCDTNGISNMGGVNVIEHSAFAVETKKVTLCVHLEKEWGDYYEVDTRPSPRNLEIAVSPETYKLKEFQAFLNKVTGLLPAVI